MEIGGRAGLLGAAAPCATWPPGSPARAATARLHGLLSPSRHPNRSTVFVAGVRGGGLPTHTQPSGDDDTGDTGRSRGFSVSSSVCLACSAPSPCMHPTNAPAPTRLAAAAPCGCRSHDGCGEPQCGPHPSPACSLRPMPHCLRLFASLAALSEGSSVFAACGFRRRRVAQHAPHAPMPTALRPG